MTDRRWRVEPQVDGDTARHVLSRDRIGNGYALADLEPPFEEFTSVAVAYRGDFAEPEAACQTLRDPDFTAMATYGDADGLAAILKEIALPDSAHIALALEHRPAIERCFALTSVSERLRMAVDATTYSPFAATVDGVEVLGPEHADELTDLYSTYARQRLHASGGARPGLCGCGDQRRGARPAPDGLSRRGAQRRRHERHRDRRLRAPRLPPTLPLPGGVRATRAVRRRHCDRDTDRAGPGSAVTTAASTTSESRGRARRIRG